MSNSGVVCEWCGATFEPVGSRGPKPKFCRRSHRQRSYEAARFASATTTQPSSTGGRSARDLDRAAAALRKALKGVSIDESNRGRPTELRTAITDLTGPLLDTLEALGVSDPGDTATVDRLVVAGLVAQQAIKVQAVLREHPRSAARLRQAYTDIDSAARALVNPNTRASTLTTYKPVLAVSIPGPDARIPAGQISCRTENNRRVIRWIPDDGNDWLGTRLEHVANSTTRAKSYQLADTKEWDRLAHDTITIVCGWISSPLPLPELLAKNATSELGRQLRSQFMRGEPEWSINAQTVIGWLELGGYIRTEPDTGITDHTLTTSQ